MQSVAASAVAEAIIISETASRPRRIELQGWRLPRGAVK
jgi:hypothetical protein